MAFELENNDSKKGVKVFFGYDIDNPVLGKISSKDSFDVLLRSAASSRGMSATGLKSKGYEPIVGNEAYGYSDNAANALEQHGTNTITFMAKQKGGSIRDSFSSGLFLFSDTMVYKAVPITTKQNLLKAILEKNSKKLPDNFMVFGDHVHELRSFALSEKFFDELKSTVLSDLTHEYSKNIESLLVTLNHLFSQESSRMMVDNGVYPIIKGQMIYLMKDVLPYEIKAWGKTFEFTECTLGCRIWWSGKDFNSGDMVIYPQNKRYRHPHAYADNRLCMNGFSGKGKGLHRVVTILKGAEYVLKHGYKPESTTNDLRRWETTRGGFR